MVTELVTFKMEQKFLQEVDNTVKNSDFQNRTEFIRDALREKLEEVKLKQAMISLGKHRGKASKKTSDKERARIRDDVFKEFEKRFK